MKNKLLITTLITVLATLMMLTAVFLPYTSAIGETAERYENNPKIVVYRDPEITTGDLKKVSLFDYAKMYSALSEEIWGDSSTGIVYAVIIGIVAVSSLIALIFAVCKKPIAVIIFNLLSVGAFVFLNGDFNSRGVVPSASYDWGIGYYVFFAFAVMAIIGSVITKILKIKAQKVDL